MIALSVKTNLSNVTRLLDSQQKQVSFATAVALTRVAKAAQTDIEDEMGAKFDRPTPFTRKSTFIKPATKAKLEAMVYIKDQAVGKNPKSLAEILRQEFTGGGRIRKRLELWLQRAGYISSEEYVAPGEGARIDQYGNMSRGQIQQVLSQLKAGPDPTSYANKGTRSKASQKKAGGMFWSRGGRLPRGVWMRSGAGVKPILIVIGSPRYKQLIDMPKIVRRGIDRRFDAEFDKAFQQAIRTAR